MTSLPVFVYGTLKRGFPNHRYLPPRSEFLQPATTLLPHPLVVGPLGVPFLLGLPNAHGAHHVRGELYSASRAALATLDTFEGVSTGFYTRIEIDVVVGADAEREEQACKTQRLQEGETVRAWTYVRADGDAGPPFMKHWTVEKLAQLEFVDEYALEVAKARFTPRNKR